MTGAEGASRAGKGRGASAWALAGLLALAGCSKSTTLLGDGGPDGGRDASRPSGALGTGCVADDDCRSGPCLSVGAGARRCSTECSGGADCPSGWVCHDSACRCDAVPEQCNGADDDCDGRIDEDATRDCGEGEVCRDGACVCETECGGECVDLDSDRRHCGACGNGCPDGQACRGGSCCAPAPTPVDLLLMVDNSNSMGEEQVALAEQFPRIVRTLSSGTLRDPATGEALATFPPVPSLHLGVLSSDMGSGGFAVPTCDDDPVDGDDGILRTSGNTYVTGCMEDYPKFLSFVPGDDAAAFSHDATCIARMGTGGCGFEQPLEAVLKAITPAGSPIIGSGPEQIAPFVTGAGHADGENAGFLRPDSLLAIVAVTDEDDCSSSDPELYNPDSRVYTGNINLRCFQFPDVVFPPDRYAKGYAHVRRDAPERLLFAAIAGVPPDLVEDAGPDGFDAILGDDRMFKVIDADMPTRLEPSCNMPGWGLAYPPRRIVRAVQGVDARGATGLVTSICQPDFTTPVGRILAAVASRLRARCE